MALLVDSPVDHGRHVLAAFSLSSDPPTRLPDGRWIPIARDRLFDLHGATSGHGLGAHVGLLDDSGHARIPLDMSKFSELRGRQIHYVVLVHDRNAPSEICRISPAGALRVP